MKITLSKELKQKPNQSALGFGEYFTDHYFAMNYENGCWQEGEILPYSPLSLDPATTVLHYGQGLFEGLKAYRNEKGVTLFRPRDNFKRMNDGAERMCMPKLDIEVVMAGLIKLIEMEKDWIPSAPNTSLYIRPTMISTSAFLGAKPSRTYKFFIILSPVGSYYAGGLAPTKIFVEDFYVRAAAGGTGEAKTLGNYASSMIAWEKAQEKGYDQVLWLDAAQKKFIEEIGSMNIFFIIDDTVITPALTGSILHGITRDSILKILKADGYKTEERNISIDEVKQAYEQGRLKESFGTGTAAVVAPVGFLNYKGFDIKINDGKTGKITKYLYDKLTGIQCAKVKDDFGWTLRLF